MCKRLVLFKPRLQASTFFNSCELNLGSCWLELQKRMGRNSVYERNQMRGRIGSLTLQLAPRVGCDVNDKTSKIKQLNVALSFLRS